MVPWCSLADAKSNAGVKVVDPPLSEFVYRGSFLPRITVLTLCAAAIGHLTIAFGFAADAETAGTAIAIVDFNYVDTSGEVRDQRAEHEVRLSVFMSTLKDDLAASGKFRVIVPACRPDPCSRSTGSELLKAAHAAGADFLLVGGIHKMSTLVQWAKAEVIDAQERPDRARQTFHLPRGHRSGVEARRRVHIKRTHYACSLQ